MVCVGKYEYMPDGSWTGAWTCTDTFKSGDTKIESWEEGSHLKEYKYKYTGGTGKYQGATGDGTYTLEELTDTLLGGRYKGGVDSAKKRGRSELLRPCKLCGHVCGGHRVNRHNAGDHAES
jgi:hypothetical protein